MLANIREIGIHASLTTAVLSITAIDSVEQGLSIVMLVVSIAYTLQRMYMTIEEKREKRKQRILTKKRKHYEEKKIKLKEPKVLN